MTDERVIGLAHTEPTRASFVAPMQATAGHVPSLDGLRAVSILLVLAGHFINRAFFPGGLGVLIFFVISGFLITRLMFAEWRATEHLSIGRFYWRRLWRLYPAVITYCLAVVGLYALTARPIDPLEPLSALFYFTNFLYASYSFHGVAGHMPFIIFWSLSIEEHFYWLFPLLFVVLRADALRLARVMMALCAICLLARLAIVFVYPAILQTSVIYWTEFRIDSIGFGVLLAALCELDGGREFLEQLTKPAPVAVAVLGVLISLLWRSPWFRETFRYSIEAGSIAVLVSAVLFSERYRPLQIALNLAPMVWIGLLSYSLYVWHSLAGIILRSTMHSEPTGILIVVELALSLAMAAVSYYAIEAPLRRRFGKR